MGIGINPLFEIHCFLNSIFELFGGSWWTTYFVLKKHDFFYVMTYKLGGQIKYMANSRDAIHGKISTNSDLHK